MSLRFAMLLAATMAAAPPSAVRKATHTAEFSDPAGDVEEVEGDVTSLALRSDGTHAVVTVARLTAQGTEKVRGMMNAPQTPIQGRDVEAKIAYADLGVKPGQTIRIAAREHGASGEAAPFPMVALAIK